MWEVLALIGALTGTIFGASGLWNLWVFWNRRQDDVPHHLQTWQSADVPGLRALRHAAKDCGLRTVKVSGSAAGRLKLTARAGPLEVRIEGAPSFEPQVQVVVVVPGLPDFSDVRIRRELRNPLSWVREIEVGDEPFDNTFHIQGPVRLVCALLNLRVRNLLASLNDQSQLEITGSEIQAQTPYEQLSHVLPPLLALGEQLSRFSQPGEVNRRLIRNARLDPAAGVRLQNLRLLVHESPESPWKGEALRRACSDSSLKIRLWAARESGPKGRDVLIALAENKTDDDCSAQAISTLGPELPFERTRRILVQALSSRRHVQTARACLESLGRSGTPAAEPTLIQALQHEAVEVRVAAAKALGRIGSAAAVQPLQEAAERSPRDQEIVQAARQAIAEIQSRLPGASPGQLSLAGAEAGQLSLAQTEAGQLSLVTDPSGQLSLPPEPET